MAIQSCDCENPQFPNLGRPGCVIEQQKLIFPIIVPRYKADGSRNTIDLTSPTLGQDIQDLIDASLTVEQERLYPFPRVFSATWERTDTQYQDMEDGTRFRLEGVGGVRTLQFMLMAKDSVGAMQRELEKGGCTDLDYYYVGAGKNIWGIMDNTTDTEIHGYELTAETWDVFKMYATDTTRQGLNVSWDLDREVCESKSYAITESQLGYNPITTLTPNISAFQTVTALTNTTVQTVVYTGFGAAGEAGKLQSLVIGDFTVENTDVPAGDISISLVETTPGTYVITTSAMTATENHKITCAKAGYDVADGTFVAV